MRITTLHRGVALLAAALVLAASACWFAGGMLVAPRPFDLGLAPADLHAQSISIAGDRAPIAGWWIEGARGMPSILLLHGVRANRLAMVGRARLFAARGYSVLLIDMPSHGETPGDAITLGWRESDAVRAAHDWIARRHPGGRIGVIGTSLGGASVLLGERPARFDAVVLEAVYSDARRPLARMLEPLLTLQIQPRIGIARDALRPLDAIARLRSPVLVIGGANDRHTLPWETRALYRRASAPKALWLVPKTGHQDFLAAAPREYATRVIGFMDRALGVPSRTTGAPETPAAAAHRPAPYPASIPATAAASNGQSSSRPVPASRSTGTRVP